MVKGLLSHTMEMAMGTLKRMKGVVASTAAICIGMGINPQKSPMSTPLLTLFLLMLKYSLGRLYFSMNLSSLLLDDFFLNTFLIMK
jgi:hypothetical protein